VALPALADPRICENPLRTPASLTHYHSAVTFSAASPSPCPLYSLLLYRLPILQLNRNAASTITNPTTLSKTPPPTPPSMATSPNTPASCDVSEGRLLLVSNRLPITIKRSDEGKYEMSMSSGGLVSGLSGLSKTTTFQWYGWPGLEVPEDEVAELEDQLKKDYNAVPIMLKDELADRHYNGFSSKSSAGSHGRPWNC